MILFSVYHFSFYCIAVGNFVMIIICENLVWIFADILIYYFLLLFFVVSQKIFVYFMMSKYKIKLYSLGITDNSFYVWMRFTRTKENTYSTKHDKLLIFKICKS